MADGTDQPVGVFSIQIAAIGTVALIFGSIPSPVYARPLSWDSV